MTTLVKDFPVRWTVLADTKDVLDILFLNDNHTTKKELVALMQKYILRCVYDGIYGQAIGVMGYKHIRSQHIEMVMLYSHPDYDTYSVMGALLEKLTEKFKSNPPAAKKLSFWVSDVDLVTQLFLKAHKFRAVQVKDDEYLMERTV